MKKWFAETVVGSWGKTLVGLLGAGAIAAGEAYSTGTVTKEGLTAAALVAIIGAIKK